MATTYQDFTVAAPVGGGGTLALSVTLKALDKSHFTLTLNGGAFTSFVVTGSTGAWTVTCNGPLSVSDAIRVYRSTPSTDAGRLVTFADGGALDQDALNTALLQQLYILQEQEERTVDGRCVAIVRATAGTTVLATASAVWHSDFATLLPLDALTQSWNNLGHVSVNTTTDQITLSAGTWRVRIEGAVNNAAAATLYGWCAAFYSASPATALKMPDTTSPAAGIAATFQAGVGYNGGESSKEFVLVLASSAVFEFHAAASSLAGSNITVDDLQVVLERLDD